MVDGQVQSRSAVCGTSWRSLQLPAPAEGQERFTGMTSTYGVIHIVEKMVEKSEKAKFSMIAGACAGCIFVKWRARFKEFGPTPILPTVVEFARAVQIWTLCQRALRIWQSLP